MVAAIDPGINVWRCHVVQSLLRYLSGIMNCPRIRLHTVNCGKLFIDEGTKSKQPEALSGTASGACVKPAAARRSLASPL
jgi:hypothetical protein